MSYFLAVDAGGTKATFLLADGERELARATCGTIKRVNADESVAENNLSEALAQLEHLTGISMSQVTRTCIGTSGNTVPLVTDWLHASFARRVGGALMIVGDVEIALDAVFHGGRGVLVLAGTGSNVAARAANGLIATTGGWGPMLADQGAGHWIGMEGLRRGFLARDEQRPTRLLEAARQLWNLPTGRCAHRVRQRTARRALRLDFRAQCCAACKEGDTVAIEILEKGGRDLAYLATLLIERMRTVETGDFHPPDIAIAGSILVNVAIERTAMQGALRDRYPAIRFIEEPADPVRGALWRAMQGS